MGARGENTSARASIANELPGEPLALRWLLAWAGCAALLADQRLVDVRDDTYNSRTRV